MFKKRLLNAILSYSGNLGLPGKPSSLPGSKLSCKDFNSYYTIAGKLE